MELKEKALIAAEESEQQHMRQMQAWSRALSRGGLHTIGYKEYGLTKAMYDYTVTKAKVYTSDTVPWTSRRSVGLYRGQGLVPLLFVCKEYL